MEQHWDLDRIFNQKDDSNVFPLFLKQLRKKLMDLHDTLFMDEYLTNNLKKQMILMQELYKDWFQSFEYSMCMTSIDTTNNDANSWLAEVNDLESLYQICESKISDHLSKLDEEEWEDLTIDPSLHVLLPVLHEKRRIQRSRAGHEIEATIHSLEGDGMHAWGELYQLALEKINLEIGCEVIPASQASSKVFYNRNRTERIEAFKIWKNEWERESVICAKALNHITGFRLKKYELRGWDSFLQESLEINRVKEETIQTMWSTVMQHKEPFLQYLERKQLLYNSEELCWTDHLAPLPFQSAKTTITYKEGMKTIIDSLRIFDGEAASFSECVFSSKWIDSASSPNKRAGAFCAPLPRSMESRIMLTYSNDLHSVGVLAHELGHAYHYSILQELPMYLQDCPQTMAEVSSTLFETIVMKDALHQAIDPKEKMELLNNMITRDIGTLLNSYVRHLFEVRLYEKRKEKTLTSQELNELMLVVQKEVFEGRLDTYDPTFWASLRHFYFTRKPFGHYPYSIAHLVSTGIYNKLKDKPDRSERLKNLLLDTTRLTVEELMNKHLDEDLSKSFFWEGALEVIFDNIKEFMEISNDYIDKTQNVLSPD